WKPIVTGSCDTGALHIDFERSIVNGCVMVNAPLVRWFGPDQLSAASPAVETTSAVVVVLYVLATPGVNGPNEAAPPRVSPRVAGTLPPTDASWAGAPCTGPLDVATKDA